jgi:hypothetical protein
MAKCNLHPSAGTNPDTAVYVHGNASADKPPSQFGVHFVLPATSELTLATARDVTHRRLLDASVAAAENSPPTSTDIGDTKGIVAEEEAELHAEPDGDELQAERDILTAQLSPETALRNESHAPGGEYTADAGRPL